MTHILNCLSLCICCMLAPSNFVLRIYFVVRGIRIKSMLALRDSHHCCHICRIVARFRVLGQFYRELPEITWRMLYILHRPQSSSNSKKGIFARLNRRVYSGTKRQIWQLRLMLCAWEVWSGRTLRGPCVLITVLK